MGIWGRTCVVCGLLPGLEVLRCGKSRAHQAGDGSGKEECSLHLGMMYLGEGGNLKEDLAKVGKARATDEKYREREVLVKRASNVDTDVVLGNNNSLIRRVPLFLYKPQILFTSLDISLRQDSAMQMPQLPAALKKEPGLSRQLLIMALMHKSANDCKFTRNSFSWLSLLNKNVPSWTSDQINVVRLFTVET